METSPDKNAVIVVRYRYERRLWYVHARVGDLVLVGPKSWLVSDYLWWTLNDLNDHEAVVVGRCYRVWPFRFFKLGPNVEFSIVPAGHSSNHPAGGTSAGTQG